MVKKGYSRHAIKNYGIVTRDFLRYLERRSIAVDAVSPPEVDGYLRARLRRYKCQHRHEPKDASGWYWHLMSPVKTFLGFVQGQWPLPGTIESELEWFKKKLAEAHRKPSTIVHNVCVARRFLCYLQKVSMPVEAVRPVDVRRYIDWELRVYRNKHGRQPPQLVEWRCGLTPAVHALLDLVHGERLKDTGWRLKPATVRLLGDYKANLQQRSLDPIYVRDLCCHARYFLEYLDERNLAIENVDVQQVASYFSFVSRRHTKNNWYWTALHRRSVHYMLRHVQGEWPPGSTPSPLFVQFRAHLKQRHFSIHTIWKHVSSVRQFLDYLRVRHIEPEGARLHDLSGFLEWKLEEHRREYGSAPRDQARWRIHYRAGIRRFMRMVDPDWPPLEEPADEIERFRRGICETYVRWMREVRGLAPGTVVKNRDEALQFLTWLGNRANRETLRNLNVSEIDRYFESRMPGLRRATRVSTCSSMRSFLRYLHAESWIDRDLSRLISGPPVYAFAEIPRAFTEEQIRTLLKTVRADRRPAALRDYAMLMLLATYGIRGGEVVRLRLEDIDWRENRIRIRLSKSGLESNLPLVTPVGNALLNYLRHGRPPSIAREVFLRARAPYDPLVSSGSLVSIIRDRLEQAGIVVEGRRGAHAFRFARAASLLRASVSLKHIGDLLGHQSVAATGIYLRLTTDNLRAISLEVPGR